jgi:hypothetical protein
MKFPTFFWIFIPLMARISEAIAALLIIMGIAFAPQSATATTLSFTIDTAPLAGTGTLLAFDLIGNGTPGNKVTISAFSAHAPIGATIAVGNVIGTFPSAVTLDDSTSFFNEAAVLLPTLVSEITFTVTTTDNGPSTMAAPDALSLLFLDPVSGMPLFSTSDPTGSNALFLMNIDGTMAAGLQIYTADANEVTISAVPGAGTAIPEPSTLLLALLGLGMLALAKRSRRRAWVACVLGFIASFNVLAAGDLSDKVSVTKSGLVLNRATSTFDGTLTISNISATVLAAPLSITIKDITGPGVAVFNKTSSDPDGNPMLQANLKNGVLAPGEKILVPLKFINPQRVSFDYTVRVSGSTMDASNSTTLHVTVHAFSGDNAQPQGAPVGAGYTILVDGVPRTTTDTAGKATFQVPLSSSIVSARRLPAEAGSATIGPMAGQTQTVDIIVSDDAELYGDAHLRIDQVQQSLLPVDFTTLRLRFVDQNEKTIKLNSLTSVELYDGDDHSLGLETMNFQLEADGTVTPANLAQIRTLLNRSGRLQFELMGTDADGIEYSGRAAFYISRNKVSGTLLPSPTFSGMHLGAIRVVGTILNTDIIVTTISDANGHFDFPNLPNGNLKIAAQTFQNDRYYYGSGVTALSHDTTLSLPMLSAQDIAGGTGSTFLIAKATAALKIDHSTELASPDVEGINARRPGDIREVPKHPVARPRALAATPNTATVDVIADAQDVPSSQSAALTVPKGTANVTLTYTVASQEYPYYVTKNSIFNDVWNVTVLAGSTGAQLYELTMQVNSQLTAEPVWLPDGTTGEIKKVLDVASLTKDADVQLILSAYATNISDSYLPTSVHAVLTPGGALKINSITARLPDQFTHNDGSYYSIPAVGKTNYYLRYFDIDFSKPGDADITKVKTELLDAGADAVVLEAAPGPDATLVDDHTLRVLASFKSTSSSIDGVPPPTDAIRFRFTLSAQGVDGNELKDDKTDVSKHPLWRMPTGMSRYSTREVGGDDWCSKRTYEWMEDHAALLKPINDISFEHGVDVEAVPHAGHAKGTDIDMYHFYVFPGANTQSGTSNYTKLVERIRDLPKQNSTNPAQKALGTEAKSQVAAWIAATRSGIDALSALSEVTQIGYINAGPNATGIGGASWGATLLKTGKVKVDGVTYEVVDDSWTNGKYRPWAGHHHHVHITLQFD